MTEYRGYNIEGDGTFGYKVIKNIGKGSLPHALVGVFTNETQAQRTINLYLIGKGKTDDKGDISA